MRRWLAQEPSIFTMSGPPRLALLFAILLLVRAWGAHAFTLGGFQSCQDDLLFAIQSEHATERMCTSTYLLAPDDYSRECVPVLITS